MNQKPEAFKSLPAVGKLLQMPEVKALIGGHGKELTTFCLRKLLDQCRTDLDRGIAVPSLPEFLQRLERSMNTLLQRSLRKVINATGVVIHTNLGRAPLGKSLLADSFDVLQGYTNLEFDPETGSRGDRNVHASALLKYLTGAEDVVVVNNNAAAVMLVLRTFAKGREVLVSRGELIEIGGSFRIPEIMAASDCKMVEVGTTNKTRINDYRKAITPKTRLFFKAHKSNYVIKGFTEEVALKELMELGQQSGIPVLYDLGSGLLRACKNAVFQDEPDVQQTLATGVDLVCFSGDKLLGGPQAGVIAGRKELIAKIRKEPMLRALRVDKVTLALLESACLNYLHEDKLLSGNPVHQIINRSQEDLRKAAGQLAETLKNAGIQTVVVPSEGQTGGGTLPDAVIPSLSVKILADAKIRRKSQYAERMMTGLLHHTHPILAVLKQGELYVDLLCVFEEEAEQLAAGIIGVHRQVTHSGV